jgi:hypothetical protein
MVIRPRHLLPTALSFTQGAADNLITSTAADSFSGWLIEATSSADNTGMYLQNNGTADYVRFSMVGLLPSTDYWLKLVVPSKGANAGNVRLHVTGTDGAGLSQINGLAANYDFPSAVPFTKYVKIRTDATAGPHLLAFRNASSSDSTALSRIKISECVVYPIPARADNIAIIGDRTAGYSAPVAAQVDAAVTHALANTAIVFSPGDMSDVSNALSINNALQTAVAGNFFAAIGNHDYAAAAGVAGWITYFGMGATYYSIALSHTEWFFYDTNDAHADNDQSSLAAAQAATMGQWLLAALAASTARWKIVVMHHPAYSSSTHHGGPSDGGGWPAAYSSMRWDWEALGVALVLQSHDHVVERMVVGDVLYYTFALGGGAANAFGTPIAESQYRALVPGYLKVHDSADALILEHFDVSNLLLDRHKITRTP